MSKLFANMTQLIQRTRRTQMAQMTLTGLIWSPC